MRMWIVLVLCARVAVADELPDEQLYRCKTKVTDVEVTFKPETDIKDLITWAMGFTCRNFVFESRIQQITKRVTLVMPNRISAPEAYKTFLVALGTMGLAVVKDGHMLKIVDSTAAHRESVPIYPKELPPSSDDVVRFVYRPEHVQPETVQAAFASVKSDVGDIQIIGPLLVITDYAAHVRDMLSLAKLIDVAGAADGIYTIPVHHATAQTLQQEVVTLLGKDPKLLVDDRTNTLVFAGNETSYRRVQALVDRLDIAVATETGATFHVYPLAGAIAEEVAKTLTDAISNQQPTGKPGDLANALEGKVKIIADKATNKLVVISSGRDYLALKDVIKQLDEPRRQVYIEAQILEVQLGNNLDLGASAHLGSSTGGGSGLMMGGIQMPQLKSTDVSTLAAASGLLGAILGPTVAGSSSILGASIPSYGVLVQALAERSNTNILSVPNIIAVDNEDAKLKVGVNIPYKKGVMPTTPVATTATTLTTNIDRQDLVLELDLKPHISQDQTVLLEIKHESKDLGDDVADLGPSWTTRSLETRVVVHDQSTVVIGGLVQEKEVLTESKVPLLGDIPVLGHLFSYKSRQKKKTNLLILLTPYIVRDELDLEALRERKIREHDEFVSSFHVLDGMKYQPRMDYRRKRGVLEEINRAVAAVEDDIAARAAVPAATSVKAGAVE